MTEEKLENETQKYPLKINEMIEELISSIEDISSNTRDKLDKFVDAFEDEFPWNKQYDRGGADAIIWSLMDSPLILFALDMNGSAIIELHGLLEVFSARKIVNLIPDTIRETIESRVIKRCTLGDLALILCDLKIWNKEDLKFVEKLKKLRNGVAHKNPKLISNAVRSGKEISILDIDPTMANVDCIPLIIKTIRLLWKIFIANTSNVKNMNLS